MSERCGLGVCTFGTVPILNPVVYYTVPLARPLGRLLMAAETPLSPLLVIWMSFVIVLSVAFEPFTVI